MLFSSTYLLTTIIGRADLFKRRLVKETIIGYFNEHRSITALYNRDQAHVIENDAVRDITVVQMTATEINTPRRF